jgi:hypothetical protein
MGWSFRRTRSLGLFPGTGLYYESSLLDERQLLPRETSTHRVSPLGTLSGVIVVGLIIYGISISAPANASAPVVPVMQTVAPVAAAVTATHAMKPHTGKHAMHRRAPVRSLEPDDMIAAEPMDAILD